MKGETMPIPEGTALKDFIVTATKPDKIPRFNPLRKYSGCLDESEAVKRCVKQSGLNHETASNHKFTAFEIGTPAYLTELERIKKAENIESESDDVVVIEDELEAARAEDRAAAKQSRLEAQKAETAEVVAEETPVEPETTKPKTSKKGS